VSLMVTVFTCSRYKTQQLLLQSDSHPILPERLHSCREMCPCITCQLIREVTILVCVPYSLELVGDTLVIFGKNKIAILFMYNFKH
jgi:hypothetical protein